MNASFLVLSTTPSSCGSRHHWSIINWTSSFVWWCKCHWAEGMWSPETMYHGPGSPGTGHCSVVVNTEHCWQHSIIVPLLLHSPVNNVCSLHAAIKLYTGDCHTHGPDPDHTWYITIRCSQTEIDLQWISTLFSSYHCKTNALQKVCYF